MFRGNSVADVLSDPHRGATETTAKTEELTCTRYLNSGAARCWEK